MATKTAPKKKRAKRNQAPTVEPRYWDKQGAAAYLSCGVRTIELKMADGTLTYFRTGNMVRFLKEDLDASMARFRHNAVES